MADQTLGSLDVVISADWSDLESAINDAVSAAQDGAQAIQDAFDQGDTFDTMAESIGTLSDALSGVEGAASEAGGAVEEAGSQMELFGDSTSEAATQVTALDDSANGIAESMIEIGDAASESASQVDELAAASEEAGSSGQAAASGLSSMREMLLELGEGLAVAEGIKDFSADVVSAYASVQTATVALTAMTGSAEGAAASIEELEQMSLQIPVATESLIAATREMTAFGLSSEQTSALVMDAANASNASGFAFDEVTSALSRLVLSGQAGARQLATLGISTQMMAAAMTQFGVAATATSAEVSKAFGALNVEQRLDVIDTALARFGGLAALQAQTVAGQWQILENQWDLTAEKIGETLAPLAQGLMSFASSVVSGISEAVDAFRELPGPIQDVGLAAVAVLGAAGPILAGLAAVGLAVEGLQGIPGTFARIAGALGLTGDAAVVATPEVAAFAGAETAAGGAGATAAPKVTAFAGAETAAGEAAVGAGVGELTTGIEAAGGAAVTATGAVGALSGVLTGLGYVAAGVAAAWGTWHLLEWATGDALAGQGALVVLSDDLKQVSTWAENVGISWDKGVASLSTSAIDTANTSIKSLGSALQKLVDLIPGAKQFTDQVQSGMQALNVAGFNAVTSIDASSKSTQNFVGWLNSTGVATSAAGEAVNSLEVKMDGLRSSLASAQATLSEEKASQDGTAVSAQNLAAAQQAVVTAQKALNAAMGQTPAELKAAQAGTQNLTASQLAFFTSSTEGFTQVGDASDAYAVKVENAVDAIEAKQKESADEANLAGAAYLTMAASGTASAGAQLAAWTQLESKAKASGQTIKEVLDGIDDDALSIPGALTASIASWDQMALSGTSSAKQIDDAWKTVQALATATGTDMKDLATQINAVGSAVGGLGAVIVNGKLQIVQLDNGASQAAKDMQAMAQQMLSMIPGFAGVATGSTQAGQGVTILRDDSNTASQGVLGLGKVIGGFGTATGGAIPSVQGLGTAVGTAATQAVYASTAFPQAGSVLVPLSSNASQAASSISSIGAASTQASAATNSFRSYVDQSGVAVSEYGDKTQQSAQFTTQYGAATSSTILLQNGLTGAVEEGTQTIENYGGTTDTATTQTGAFAEATDNSGQAAGAAQGPVDALGTAYQDAGNDAANAAQQVDLFNDAVSGSVGAATSVQGDMSGGKKGYGVPLPPAGQGLTGLTESYDPAVTGDIVQSYVAAVGNAITAAWNTKQTAAVQQQIQQLEAVASGQAWFPGSSGPNAKDEQQAEQALQQMGISFSGVATSANSTSSSLSTLLSALASTTTSSNNLSNSLTGASLAPDLDTTTTAVDAMTTGLAPLRDALSDTSQAQGTLTGINASLGDSSAGLGLSLLHTNVVMAPVTTVADQLAEQLVALYNSGQGASAAAAEITQELETQSNAADALQNAMNATTDSMEESGTAGLSLSQIVQQFGNIWWSGTQPVTAAGVAISQTWTALDDLTDSTATATAAVGTDSSSGLTSAVTSLGVAAGSAAALIGQITSTSAPSGGTQISPSQIDTPQGAWYLSTMNGVTVWTLQSGTAQVPPAPETPTALTGAAAAIGQTSSSSAPREPRSRLRRSITRKAVGSSGPTDNGSYKVGQPAAALRRAASRRLRRAIHSPPRRSRHSPAGGACNPGRR